MKSPQSARLGDLLGRVGIVTWFTHDAILKAFAIYADVLAWLANAPDSSALRILSQTGNLAFLALIVATTIFRLQPLQSAEGLAPRIAAFAGTFALLFLNMMPPTTSLPPALTVFALCLLLTGFVLSAYVLYWLGRSFSIMAEARRLVTAGPYAIVRHPLYMTEEIAIIGFLLLNLSIPAMLLGVLHWALQLRRMHHEEQVLRAAFPEYEHYAAMTPKFFPRLNAAPVRKPT